MPYIPPYLSQSLFAGFSLSITDLLFEFCTQFFHIALTLFPDPTISSEPHTFQHFRQHHLGDISGHCYNGQYFCNDVLSSYASTTSGIDIEFIDAVDGMRKYCQVKAGPNTINKDDVPVIKNHFRSVINLARTNGMRIASNDCIVGVFYGTHKELSSHYKKIDEDYPVIVGQDFWYHLTGDPEFYDDLITAFADVADEMDSSALVQNTVDRLAFYIKELEDEE